MSSLAYRTPQLPWAEGKSEQLFNKILVVLLAVTIGLGILVPNITLPEIKREKAEKLPPQLAKVIKRKKAAPKPKPKPIPKVEKKVEKKVEPKKVEPKPQPKKAAPKPKPKPKPKKVSKKERTPERIKAAKAKAKKLISSFSNDLAAMQNMVDMSALTVDSTALTNAGAAATAIGSVVDQTAVDRVGGVDESQLTRATGAEQLAAADRDTTEVAEVDQSELVDAQQDAGTIAGMARSQMQIRRVFEQNKSRFDRIYRKALRSNPTLQGTVTLGITVASTGEVSDCAVKTSEIDDSKVVRRITMTCKMLAFDAAKAGDEFDYPLTFAP